MNAFFVGALSASLVVACSNEPNGPMSCPPMAGCPQGEVVDPNTCACTVDNIGEGGLPDADASSDGALLDGIATDASGDADDVEGRPCTSNTDCGGGDFSCLYPVADGCNAKQVCIKVNPSAGSCIAVALCGCDGSDFSDTFCEKPGTYKPVAHGGFCEEASVPDAS